MREFHVNSGRFSLKFGIFGNSYEFRTNLEIVVKYASSARDIRSSACDIRTNFVRICRIRTHFVRISHEIRTNFAISGPKAPEHVAVIFFGRRLGLMGPFGMGLSLNHGD